MKHIRKITTSIMLITLLSVGAATAVYAAQNCGQVSEAKKLYDAAKRVYDNPPAELNGWIKTKGKEKTVAAVRVNHLGKSKIIYFISGWKKANIYKDGKIVKRKTFMQLPIPIVRDMAKKVGYRGGKGFVANKGNDQPSALPDDRGIANSSHAETQALFKFRDITSIGIYNEDGGDMCVSCQNFYHHLFANILKREMVARTQNCIYRFNFETRGNTKTFKVKGSPKNCNNKVGSGDNYKNYGYTQE